MKRIIVLCLGMLILLAACGSKVDGTYKNDEMSIKASKDSDRATLHLKSLENDGGIFGVEKNDGNVEGRIDKDKKTMSFDVQGETMKYDYKVKGDKLILINPDKDDEKIELKKE
ncbi:hypothetical protein H3984_06985 [Staphylococcus warneri]|uniref:hypothetical protein n=1 Tax=Staphylococcus warneri TaxID=1292 RepID=UPI000D1D24BA|nr:hypothetical protein [Staphylococcus warneri]MBF2177513.1 hypothetical protein [Staphylococcus warneri]MBF2180724.1 hypothetical protein [Staphylococcus warneri]MBF2184389.1 hypothetical protein [Staphylococcus warneri]MBF2263917.1 hypothetical protein [Staphylococcus warneri]MBF2266901.1 hypothetical protein [Staphylococcus warneri]